jgi:hypothetical protein
LRQLDPQETRVKKVVLDPKESKDLKVHKEMWVRKELQEIHHRVLKVHKGLLLKVSKVILVTHHKEELETKELRVILVHKDLRGNPHKEPQDLLEIQLQDHRVRQVIPTLVLKEILEVRGLRVTKVSKGILELRD